MCVYYSVMKISDDFDHLKVRYVGDYYSVRLKKNKVYFAERDPVFGMLRLEDELGEENSFMPEEFEVVKILDRGGMPDDENGTGNSY